MYYIMICIVEYFELFSGEKEVWWIIIFIMSYVKFKVCCVLYVLCCVFNYIKYFLNNYVLI